MKNDFEKDKFKILYEDNHLAVIYKPEGLLSVPYPGSTAKTALALLEQIMRKKGTFSKNHRPFAVHRLDRETSGIMMFALSENAKKIIMDSWQKIVTKRIYRAVAENSKNPLPDSGTISDGLAYNAYNIAFVPDKNSKEKFKTQKFQIAVGDQFKTLNSKFQIPYSVLMLSTGFAVADRKSVV